METRHSAALLVTVLCSLHWARVCAQLEPNTVNSFAFKHSDVNQGKHAAIPLLYLMTEDFFLLVCSLLPSSMHVSSVV